MKKIPISMFVLFATGLFVGSAKAQGDRPSLQSDAPAPAAQMPEMQKSDGNPSLPVGDASGKITRASDTAAPIRPEEVAAPTGLRGRPILTSDMPASRDLQGSPVNSKTPVVQLEPSEPTKTQGGPVDEEKLPSPTTVEELKVPKPRVKTGPRKAR